MNGETEPLSSLDGRQYAQRCFHVNEGNLNFFLQYRDTLHVSIHSAMDCKIKHRAGAKRIGHITPLGAM